MDASLINEIQKGNERAFKQLFDQYHEKLYFFFLKKTKCPELCEELVQTALIKCWHYRNRLRSDLSMSSQLFRIAKTTLIDLLRKRAAERIVALHTIHEHIAEEMPPIEPEKIQEITAKLYLLPPVRRKIIEYRLEGLSNQEIAEQLAISKKTVENQFNRALHDIRKYISIATLLVILHPSYFFPILTDCYRWV